MDFFLLRPGAFRLLLAGLVLVSHMSSFSTGRLGVILFFLLSGYWISDLWRRQGIYGSGLFFLNRFLRIWPLYIVTVLAAAWMLNRPLGIANFTIFGVASVTGDKPLGVEWSLDIEAQFYLLLPLLIKIRPPLWVGGIVTVLGWIFVYYTGVHNVFMYLPAFGAGMMLYRYRASTLTIQPVYALIAFCLLTGILAMTSAGRAMLSNRIPDVMNEDIFAMIWAIPLVIYIAHSLRRASGKIDRHLGNLSYPLYLIHEPIIQFVSPHSWMVKLSILIGSLGAAIIAYIVLDIPIERFRYRVLKRLEARKRERLSLNALDGLVQS